MSSVSESFYRVRNDDFAKSFYALLLDADSRIRPLFKNTNFNRQRELLLEGIAVLLQYAEGKAVGEMAIERLGELHSRKQMDISPDLYPLWIDCLVKTLSVFDPQFNADLETQWREALQKGINIIINMH